MWCSTYPLRARVSILRLWDDFGSQFDRDGDYKEYENLRRQNNAEIASTGATLTHRERQQIAAGQIEPRASRAGVDLDSFLGVTGRL